MGIKGLHQYLRTSNSLQQGVNVPQQLVENDTNIIFVDFCCEFFQLFQATSALELFRLQLRGATVINTSELVLHEFLVVVLARLQHLLNQIPGLTTICLVFDGDPLYAKKETHKARKLRRQDAIKLARRRFPGSLDNISDRQLSKYAKQWLTFTADMKNSIIGKLDALGYLQYDENDLNQQGIVFLSAPLEADPVVVHLAENRANSAIISRDGDLFAYFGAVDVPRILKFNWDIGEQFGQGDMTTKRQLLNALAGHHIANDQELQMAQIEFAVHAAASGNDYAKNIPQISFVKIHQSLQALRPFAGNANNVLQRLVEALGNRANPFFVQCFQIALTQYARPIVGANDIRSVAMPFQVTENLLQYTGLEPPHPQTGPQEQGSRYTFLQPDGEYFQEQFGHTSPENIDALRPRPAGRPTTLAKRAKRFAGSQRYDDFKSNQTFMHPDGSEVKAYSYKSRLMVTCHAGLYSSVLAVRDRSALQATIITNALRTLVNKMSFARFASLQIADIAMRQAFTTLNLQQRHAFYSNFFHENKNVREMTWRRILLCATNYQPVQLPRGFSYQQRGQAIAAAMSIRLDDIVNENGGIHNGDQHVFKAYADDVAYSYLYQFMQDDPTTCHILLKARKIWYSGDFGTLHTLVPGIYLMDNMVTEIVHGLDLAFRQNVVRNFRARYCDYLRRRLQETAECPQGWNNNQDFRNTVIQAVQAETRQQATGIIQEDQTIAQEIRQAVIDFVQRMHTKYHNNLDGFGHNICTQELINEATVPEQWPANRDSLVRYLFQQIWNIPLYSGEDNRDMDEQADNQQAQQDIEQLPQGIQNAITNFINGERNLQVTNIPVNQYDIRACLGIDPPAPPQVIEQPTAIGLGIARPGNGNGNGDHNGDPGDNANYVGNADEDEFEEDDLEEEYYGRPLKGAASPLVPLMVHMLEHCNGYLTFPLVPHQPWGPIAIPFDHAFTQKAIFQGIKHLVNPQISDMQRRIIEAIQNGNMENADMLEQELDAMEAEINAFHRLTSTKNRFNQLFDIRRCATMINDQKQVTERGYRRWLDSDITWTKAGKKLKAKRFTPRPFFLTDGIRLYTIHVDWLRGKREGVQAKFMTELRRTTREAMIPILGPDNEGLRQGVNLSNHYRGVVGMDFGEVCAVASVYRPTNSTLQGSQLVIKRGFLYGRAFLNRDKYNKMKATNGIDHLLTELGASTYQGTYQQLVQFLDLIKANTRAYRLWMFQSKACVMRFKWDNSMSMRSRLDQACYLVTNQASATDIVPDERPLVFGFGLDGISQQSRRGAVTPMDQKLINALFRKIKQANRGRQVNARDICTRVDEYMTSQTCCRCIKNAEISQAEYHVRQATINDRMTQNAQGQVQLFRVVRCAQHPDQHTYHRDGNAAENMATILRYMIRFQRRPNRFIRQSRVLAAEQ